MDVIVLNVSDGTKVQTPDTKSYINVENAAVVMDLLILNHKEQAVDPKLIAIITPYKAQVKLYNEARSAAVPEGLVPSIDCLPEITWTADQSQRQQAGIGIHD
jgi:AAA domain